MTLDDLAAFGADVSAGLGRCMNKEDLYLRLVNTVKADPGFATLFEALAAGDLDTAFSASHALKGVLGNLGITPLQKPLEELCELLRARTQMDYEPLLHQIQSEYERFCAL